MHRHSLIHLLLLGGTPSERAEVAIAFHRESPVRYGAFVTARADRDEASLQAGLRGWLSSADPEPGRSLLRAADGGTLLIDFVERLSLDSQRLLLRFLRRLAPAGDAGEAPAWAGRLAVGSSLDLEAEVSAGRFLPSLHDSLDKIRVDLGLDPGPRGFLS